MAQKQTILECNLKDETDLWDEMNYVNTITQSQRKVVCANVTPELPCRLIVQQRSALGPIDVRVIGAKGERVFKITQRAKIREQYALL